MHSKCNNKLLVKYHTMTVDPQELSLAADHRPAYYDRQLRIITEKMTCHSKF